METVCLQCGDEGCTEAFEYCVKCRDFAVHRYCLDVVPKSLDEEVHWVCDDCEEEWEDDSLIRKDDAIPFETRDSEGSGVETSKSNFVIVTTEDQVYEGALQQSYDACPHPPCESDAEPSTAEHFIVSYNESQRSSKKRKTVSSSGANFEDQRQGIESTGPLDENDSIDFENQCPDSNDHNGNRELVDCSATPLQTINFWNYSLNESNTSSMLDPRPCPEPIIRPIWRGSFDIQNQKNDILNGLMAHISNKACHKVYEEASQFQPVLHLEMLPKSDVWPKSFEISEPTSDNIALYFFPSEISKRVFDLLLDEMVLEELAMRTFVQNAELLVFPSDLLPLQYWKFQGKYYLWGVFRGKPAPSRSHSCTEELVDKPLMHENIPNVDIIEEVKLKNLDPPSPQSQNNFMVIKDDAIACKTRESKATGVETKETNVVVVGTKTKETNVVVVRTKEQDYEGALQKSYDACPQPPCESDAVPRVVLDNETERSSKRMKSVGSFEARFEEQSQGTCSSIGPRDESEDIILENRCLDMSAKGRCIGPSSDHNDNSELVVRTERFAIPLQTSNLWNNFPNYSNTSSNSYPYPEPIWRGSVNVWNQNNHIVYGVMSHISNSTCQKVYEEACQFQPPLYQFQPPPHHFQPSFHQFQPPPHHFQPPLHQFQPPLHMEMLPKSDVRPNVVEPELSSSKNRLKRLRKKMRKKMEKGGLELEPKKAKEEFKGRNKKKNNFKKNNKSKGKCEEFKGRNKKEEDKSKGKCFYCGVEGHWKRNCTKFLSER